MRALPRERPETLTTPPDGTTLEEVIGDLQSHWGVPAYPQEYRITLKVAEEKEARNGKAEPVEEEAAAADPDAPKREKAPAAPRVGTNVTGEGPRQREQAPATKRRRRRRRRKGGGGGGGGSAPNNGGGG